MSSIQAVSSPLFLNVLRDLTYLSALLWITCSPFKRGTEEIIVVQAVIPNCVYDIPKNGSY